MNLNTKLLETKTLYLNDQKFGTYVINKKISKTLKFGENPLIFYEVEVDIFKYHNLDDRMSKFKTLLMDALSEIKFYTMKNISNQGLIHIKANSQEIFNLLSDYGFQERGTIKIAKEVPPISMFMATATLKKV